MAARYGCDPSDTTISLPLDTTRVLDHGSCVEDPFPRPGIIASTSPRSPDATTVTYRCFRRMDVSSTNNTRHRRARRRFFNPSRLRSHQRHDPMPSHPVMAGHSPHNSTSPWRLGFGPDGEKTAASTHPRTRRGSPSGACRSTHTRTGDAATPTPSVGPTPPDRGPSLERLSQSLEHLNPQYGHLDHSRADSTSTSRRPTESTPTSLTRTPHRRRRTVITSDSDIEASLASATGFHRYPARPHPQTKDYTPTRPRFRAGPPRIATGGHRPEPDDLNPANGSKSQRFH